MKRIRNLTIILLSFIIMLCLAVGIVLCFPAQESSARAADAPRAKSLTRVLAKDYPELAKGTRYIVGPVSMREKYADVGEYGITYVTYEDADTFFAIGTDSFYVKVNAVNWPSDGMVHLIIPKEVTYIASGYKTNGEVDANLKTFHNSELNVYSIEFEDGSNFANLGEADASGAVDLHTEGELTYGSGLREGQVFGPDSNLRKITFPDNGKSLSIGAYAFYETTAKSNDGSAGLQSVKILNKTSVTIGTRAFQNCKGLRTFDANLNCTTSVIGDDAFSSCNNLYRAVLPGGLKKISRQAFIDCSLLSDVLIPDSVASIEGAAFGNSGLARVKLPDGVNLASGAGNEAFSNCSNLMEIETAADISKYNQFWEQSFGTGVLSVATNASSSNFLRTAEGLLFVKATADKATGCQFVNYDSYYEKGNWYLGGYLSPTARSNKWNTFDKIVLPDELNSTLSVYELNYVSDVYEDEYNGEEYDYLAITGTAGNYEVDFVKNDRSALNVKNYDIARRAFYDKYAPYVEISKAVVNIGNLAFNGSRLTSLVMGESVTGIGYGALSTDSTGLTVYIKNNNQDYGTAFNGAEPTKSSPVYFIYESKSAFDSKVEVNYYVNVNGSPHTANVITTYIVPVKYSFGDKTYTEYRLHGKEYDFVRRDNNLWGTDYNLTGLHNLADEFFGEDKCADYASTKWYKENGFENVADLAYINQRLGAEVADIEIYTKKVTKADNAYIEAGGNTNTGWTYSDTVYWTKTNNDVDAQIAHVNMAGVSGSATVLKNAGEYTVTFTLAEKWGKWVSSEKVTLAVSQQEIALSNSDYAWRVNGNEFQNGNIYYSNNKYTAYAVNGVGPITGYFVPYMNTADKYTVAVNVNNTYSRVLTLNYTDNEINCSANGSYTTTVKVSLEGDNANNYRLNGLDNSSVMWYIVEYANELNEFGIEDFTYGATGVSFPVPEAKYGNATGGTAVTFNLKNKNGTEIVSGTNVTGTEGYSYYVNSSMPSGEYELTVTVGAATSGGVTYVAYDYKFGFEVLKADFDAEKVAGVVAALRGGHESAYAQDISFLYGSTVTDALTALNGKLIKPADNTYWAKSAQAGLFATSVDFLYTATGGGYVKYDATTNKGFNAIGKYTVYYNLRAANYSDLVDIQNSADRDAHSYSLVIFQNMNPFAFVNTNALTWVAAGVEVKLGVLNDSRYNIKWSSSENYSAAGNHTVTLTSNDSDLYRWDITTGEQNGIKVAGNAQAVTVTYVLNPATNNFIMNPTMSGWEYNQFGTSGIALTFRPVHFDYVDTTHNSHPFTVNFYKYSEAAAGNKGDKLNFVYESAWNATFSGRIEFTSDTAAYTGLNGLTVGKYVAEVVFAYSPNFTNGSAESGGLTGVCTFEVRKGVNGFSQLSMAGWAWNTFGVATNLPVIALNTDTTNAGNSKFVSLTFTNNSATETIYYAGGKFYSLSGSTYTEYTDNALKAFFDGFDAGLWTLKAAAPESADVAETESSIQFSVILADNGWVNAPQILGWKFGEKNNFVAGETIYKNSDGTSLTRRYYSDAAKQKEISDLTNYLNNLSAGNNYVLVVSVEGIANKFGSLDYTLTFSVAPGDYEWKSGSGTDEAPYQPEMTIPDPVFGSTDKLGVTVLNGTAGKDYSYTATYYTVIGGVISGSGSSTVPANAGNYAVVVTVSRLKDGKVDGNYVEFTETLFFRIEQKVSKWNGTQENPAPVDGSTVSQSYDGISVPSVSVADAEKYAVKYVVVKNGVSTRAAAADGSCATAAEVVEYIKSNGIGTYTVTFTATTNDNNYANFQTVTTYVISVAQNSWDADSVYTSASAIFGENPALTAFTNAGGASVTYSVAGTQISEMNVQELNRKIAAQLDAGTYTVNVSTQAGNYTALSERFSLTINKADNAWDKDGLLNNGNATWAWGNKNVTFTGPDAKITDAYTFIIRNSAGETVATPVDNAGVLTEIGKLNAGAYTLTVTASGNRNYNSISKPFDFEITRAANAITSLSITGWTYGSAANTPASTATHGTPSFTYERKNGNDWVSVNVPSDAGTYRVTATVSETGNYAAATRSAEFAIAKAEAAISGLTIGGFQWNGYDKTTFAQATSNSPAAISYAVYSGTNKLFNITLDANGLPDDAAVTDMNGLVAGAYRLVASTEATTNYNPSSDETSFTVTAASNGWLVTPGIRSWVHYLFDDEVNMPYAAPQYGNITVEIRRESDNELIYSGTMTVTVGSDGKYSFAHTGNTAKLWNAVGGVYVLTVTVSGEAGKYNGLTSTARFDIFTGSASRPQNYWEEVPSIDSWTSEYQDYTTPAGVPNRWTTVTHEYYEAERTQDGFISGDTVLATITRTYVGAGSPDKFEVDGTMPQKPGWYKVVYTSEYEDGETVYEADALTYTVYFQILEAENSWIETPSIENWLLNGEASVPTTGSAMYDSDYEITYRPFDDPDATPVEEKPTTAGRYVMIVTAKAKVEGKRSLYCKDIVSEVVFTVSLAVNEWITPPVMENWSEEFSDQEHNPVAEAKAGTVTYYYYDSNHELLKEKPTAAGDYFMVAEVEAEGYEKLSAEVKFTITSAWDESLILVDIVLGIAACAATVVAIIFAKRRKSQC